MICIWSSWCHCHHIICSFIKIQNGLTFLVPAYPGCPGKEAIKRVSVWHTDVTMQQYIINMQCTGKWYSAKTLRENLCSCKFPRLEGFVGSFNSMTDIIADHIRDISNDVPISWVNNYKHNTEYTVGRTSEFTYSRTMKQWLKCSFWRRQ